VNQARCSPDVNYYGEFVKLAHNSFETPSLVVVFVLMMTVERALLDFHFVVFEGFRFFQALGEG